MSKEKKTSEELVEEIKELKVKIRRLESSVRDIAEQKSCNEALKETETKYRTIFESTGTAIAIIEENTIMTLINSEFEKLCGFSKEKVEGKKSWTEFASKPDLERMKQYHHKRRSDPDSAPRNYEFTFINKCGEEKRVYLTAAMIPGTKKSVASLIDITERKLAEEALMESEDKYRSLFENTKDVVYITSKGGEFVDINPAGAELFGYNRKEMLSSVNIMDIYSNPTDRESFVTDIETKGFLKDYPLDLRNKDGRDLKTLVTSVVRTDNNNNIIGYHGIIRDVTEQKRAEEELKDSFNKLKKAMNGTVQAMKLTAEMRDPYTAGHHLRVSNLAVTIAGEMGLPEERTEGIRMAAIIHDIGKVCIPAEILSKPGLLSEVEFNVIKTHPQVGYEILKTIEFPWPIADVVLQHHERMDGSTYPNGLKGDEIMLEARILGVADVVEAMASHRPYRPALGTDKALKEISQNSGKLFDREVVRACLSVFKSGFEFDTADMGSNFS